MPEFHRRADMDITPGIGPLVNIGNLCPSVFSHTWVSPRHRADTGLGQDAFVFTFTCLHALLVFVLVFSPTLLCCLLVSKMVRLRDCSGKRKAMSPQPYRPPRWILLHCGNTREQLESGGLRLGRTQGVWPPPKAGSCWGMPHLRQSGPRSLRWHLRRGRWRINATTAEWWATESNLGGIWHSCFQMVHFPTLTGS